jgi:NAD(P)-dependent dehydrogenase (short-subunit alcohol dehydrogenase family)
MGQELSGKVAIVTGGASGLGRASVERFIQEGAKVVIADVVKERGEELAAHLGGAARFKLTDVSEADQVQALVDFAVSEFGGLDIMFNNAGISQAMHSHFVDDDLGDFQKVINVNLLGIMLGSQRAARYMKDHGGGSIINTASVGGTMAGFGMVTYRTAKAAVIYFTKCIAIDFAEYGIRVNSLSPGNIQTEMTAFPIPGMTPEQIERIAKAMQPIRYAAQPLKRRGTPDDIANAALFLASDRSAQITGLEMVVDGGATAGDPVNHFEAIMAARAKILAEMK